jgi:pimeloyl-ACP methyl ester carboxylesterase
MHKECGGEIIPQEDRPTVLRMTEILAHHGILKDVNLHVDDTGGAGRAVVLIHGWPLSGESWSEQVPAFTRAGYRVITYDRRGFGRSDKPKTGYGYDTLAEDLEAVLDALHVTDATLVGFSMGGGEVARYVSKYGTDRVHSVVFASAVTPFMLKGGDNPDGPLSAEQAADMAKNLETDEAAFYDDFVTQFFSANGALVVTTAQRDAAIAQTRQADKHAALQTMTAFGSTDFRDDLPKITVPTLVIHGDSDGTVPFEGSGARTHSAIAGSDLHLVVGGPHGVNVSHADKFNEVLLAFLAR